MSKKQKILLAGAAFFAALFFFSGGMYLRQYADGKQSAEVFENIAGLVVQPEATPVPDGSDDGDSTEEVPQGMSAFEKYAAVHEQNSDFVGWISIEDTAINYPVMQTIDRPNFYLKHGFDGQYSDYGVPYIQENCALGVSDNIVIYGHHMANGSMFSDLCKYTDKSFYDNHPVIHFDTLSGYGEYEVVAVFKTAVYTEGGFKYYHFTQAENEEEFDAFISECKAASLYDTGVTAEYGDRLLTLSTCEYSQQNGRMVIVARKNDAPAVETNA